MTTTHDTEFLLSKFSHELRNPLTSLYSTLQLIETAHPETKEFRHWETLHSDISYMIALLNDMSSFTKSERLSLSKFSLRQMLIEASLSFAASITASDVEYTSKIPPILPPIVGDEIKLREVVQNLLQNAYEASLPKGSVYLDVSVTREHVSISVQDSGCGITKAQLPTIFEPFVTYKKHGSGLGLAICKQIVDAHQGTISVQSEASVGSTFTITLPRGAFSFEERSQM